ncbi:unnamed protein product [Tilletia controversa]|nr:unnamed protein product [Tilletia controversa]CAD6964398.1 unnamed protein product [Tilletia controversa]CAD6981385.1 unnamed protein product [Tilletia controversa]CAD6982214.1 unnamed protein product [Tilletia controversa]
MFLAERVLPDLSQMNKEALEGLLAIKAQEHKLILDAKDNLFAQGGASSSRGLRTFNWLNVAEQKAVKEMLAVLRELRRTELRLAPVSAM